MDGTQDREIKNKKKIQKSGRAQIPMNRGEFSIFSTDSQYTNFGVIISSVLFH